MNRALMNQNTLPFVDPPSGSLASAPVASAGNLGMLYLETGNPLWPNGRVHQSRYNGNYVNSGVTDVKDRVIPSVGFDANLEFDLNIIFRQDPADSVAYTGLLTQGSGATNTRGIWLERGGAGGLGTSYSVAFYDNISSFKSLGVYNIVDGKFHSLRIKRVSNIVSVYVDSVLSGTINMTGFVVNTGYPTTIGAQPLGLRAINGNIAKCAVVCSTGCFTYEFNQATGATILDTSGNGNNGTLTDALPTDFWKIGWTPIQW